MHLLLIGSASALRQTHQSAHNKTAVQQILKVEIMVANRAKILGHNSWLLSSVQFMGSVLYIADAMQGQKTPELLIDDLMKEPLLYAVLPHLGLETLTHLRASCSTMRVLLDSELCTHIWLQAAQRLFPEDHADPGQACSCMRQWELQPECWLMLQPSALPQAVLQLQEELADCPAADNEKQPQHQKLPQQSHQDGQAPDVLNEHRQNHEGLGPAAHPQQETASSPQMLVSVQQQLQDQAALLESLSRGGRIAVALLLSVGLEAHWPHVHHMLFQQSRWH